LVREDCPGEEEEVAPGVEAEVGYRGLIPLVFILRQRVLFPMELILPSGSKMN
jgi:hypothetical protein